MNLGSTNLASMESQIKDLDKHGPAVRVRPVTATQN